MEKGLNGAWISPEAQLHTSLRAGPEALLQHVCDRWSIENSWHWPLDIQLKQDAHRDQERNDAFLIEPEDKEIFLFRTIKF